MAHYKPAIRRLVLERFRSIPSACITFDNPTIFVGRNGSGKSNLISAFSFLADAMNAPLRTVLDRAGGLSSVRNRSAGGGHPPRLGMRVDLGRPERGADRAWYSFELASRPNHGFSVSREQCVASDGKSRSWFDRNGARFRSNVRGLAKPPIDDASLILPVVGGFKVFHHVWRVLSALRVYAIDPGELRQMQDPDPGFALQPSGGNVASVLKDIQKRSPQTFAQIVDALATVVPDLDAVSVKVHGKKLALQFTQRRAAGKRLNFDAFNMSDGTSARPRHPRGLVPVTPTAANRGRGTRATIHPGALESILDVLLAASEAIQVVMTTHSPELLDAKWITDRHLRMVDWREGATHVGPVSGANRAALQRHLMGAGELLRAKRPRTRPDCRRASPAASVVRERLMVVQPIVEGPFGLLLEAGDMLSTPWPPAEWTAR